MLVEQQGTTLVEFTGEHLDDLLQVSDGVIAGWVAEGDIPRDTTPEGDSELRGEVLFTGHGVTMWLGKRQDAYESDTDPHRARETPRVWLDRKSAEKWVELAGDTESAARVINAYLVHDADPEDPDCDKRDEDTGYTCTLARGHEGNLHLAGLGFGLVIHVFEGR